MISATWHLIYFWYFICSFINGKQRIGRGGGAVKGPTDYYFAQLVVLQSHNSLQVFKRFGELVCFFSCENEARGYSAVYQSVWYTEDAWNKLMGWGEEGRKGWGSGASPKARGSAEMQYNSLPLLPCIKLLSTDLHHLSCYSPHPCLSITQSSSTSCRL